MSTASPAEHEAMVRALDQAARGPVWGPNPRVGCVLLSEDKILGIGHHRGAGTPHAEVAALADADRRGVDVRGATAVVTLEPCAHQGRTGPCAEALIAAGIARVVIGISDPNPLARGGAEVLRDHGIEVVTGIETERGEELLRVWLAALRNGRPFVTIKIATSLDGRIAAQDGSSRWITGPESRRHAHAFRAEVDAIVVGTGTVVADDPRLTARGEDGKLLEHQPLRVVVGHRGVGTGALVRDLTAMGSDARASDTPSNVLELRTRDIDAVLTELAQREVRHALIEGGPTLISAFLRAGAVDQVHAYSAPVLIGDGPTALQAFGVDTIGAAPRLHIRRREALGTDIFLEGTLENLQQAQGVL